MDLSVLIPAKNEIYLSRTVKDILANIRADTEILICLDGAWADPAIQSDPRVRIFFHNKSVGQRAGTNDLAKAAKGKYVMKIDAHCKVDEGFDQKMLDAFKETGDNVIMIPALYNLHAFNWRCKKCGNEWYQSPTPKYCYMPGESRKKNEACDGKEFEKVMVWERRESRRSECYRFDTTLHFQYDRKRMRDQEGDIIETMSAQGSCFMLTKKKYFELNICDEGHGSWGQQGTEVGCKIWLSGGRLLTNRRTWYAHLFRTQGGDFGFPFKLSGSDIQKARSYSKDLWFNNNWEGQTRPLSWLIDKFTPLPDWHHPQHKEIYDKVKKAGEEFYKAKKIEKPPTKGIIFYTDNRLKLKIAHEVQSRLKKMRLPIVSASLKPMKFGKNIHIDRERGYLTMFIQILEALENSDADIIFHCEHDVLYHPSHFDFVPPRKDMFYYNTNIWKVRYEDGHAFRVDDCKQTSGLCAYRELLLEHYRKRVKMVQENGFTRRMGFEPGTHSRKERVDDYKCGSWESKYPNVDVRHNSNLTQSRWHKEQFRNQKYTLGWKESTNIPGWGETKDFLP